MELTGHGSGRDPTSAVVSAAEVLAMLHAFLFRSYFACLPWLLGWQMLGDTELSCNGWVGMVMGQQGKPKRDVGRPQLPRMASLLIPLETIPQAGEEAATLCAWPLA